MIDSPDLARTCVVGCSGAGKSTLAKKLAAALDAPHVELDSLYWRPGWEATPTDEFRRRVAEAAAGERWVMCGNYHGKTGDLRLERATAVVWLDYPLRILLWRLLKRTARRVVSRENLWGTGNRETLATTFGSDSIFLWLFRTYRSHRRRYAELMHDPAYAGVRFMRLESPRETNAWLEQFESGVALR
ncbi:MAG: hypothetical protein AAGJ97_03905 [Planctomycetota bacterium]